MAKDKKSRPSLKDVVAGIVFLMAISGPMRLTREEIWTALKHIARYYITGKE